MVGPDHVFSLFFFNDTATTEIYTLSLHDALPISADLHTGQRRWDSCLRNAWRERAFHLRLRAGNVWLPLTRSYGLPPGSCSHDPPTRAPPGTRDLVAG